MNIITGNYISN